jgi:hypothetical protein
MAAPDAIPGKRLTDLSSAERNKLITRNTYNSDEIYNANHPNAVSNGDPKGKGNAQYLGVYDNDNTGGSIDILGNGEPNTGRIGNLKNNLFQKDTPYSAGNLEAGKGYNPTVDTTV